MARPNSALDASLDLRRVTSVPTRHSFPVDSFQVKAEAAVSDVSSDSGLVHVLNIRLDDLTISERDRLADLVRHLQWSVDIDAPLISIQLMLLDKDFADLYCSKLQGKIRFDRVLNYLEALDQHHFWASHEMPQDLYDTLASTAA